MSAGGQPGPPATGQDRVGAPAQQVKRSRAPAFWQAIPPGPRSLALGVLVFVANLWVSARRPVLAGNDPWEGHTLEWWTTSPPPRHNFDSLPAVRSYSPLHDRRLSES